MIRTTWITILALLTLAGTAGAQNADDTAASEEPLRHYTVEVIIFSYTEDVSSGTELFTPDAANPDSVVEYSDTSAAGQRRQRARKRTLDIVPLTRSELTLSDVRRKLDRLDVYRPLMHFGWTQPMYSKEETPALSLRRFGRPPAGLGGELTMYLGRYLHFDVDLAMPAATESTDPLQGQTLYRINEDRIIKNGELRYYDHPKFGVLAKVTRVEEDA